MTDLHAEYQAAKDAAALLDLSGRAQIELTGGDRVKFLHNFCTNDIKRLKPGEGCEAFVTNVKGRVLGHVFVFAGADSLWIDSVPEADETLVAHLERYLITEDVAIQSRTAEFGELLVSGPQAAGALAKAGVEAGDLELCSQTFVDVAGTLAAVRRVDWLNAPGLLLLVERDKLGDAQQALADAGAHTCGPQTFDALRIEAGFPQYGRDISDDNIAQEVGRTSQAISFTKGCYLGQEPIARLDAMGHVNRQLCGLRLAAGPIPEAGSLIFDEAGGKEVGRITSSALSPADDLPVALAYLRSQYLTPGTTVLVRAGEDAIPATVAGPEQD